MKIKIMADYYPRFRCKCGNCKDTCCGGWQIGVSQQQYYRLIGLECSEELHRKLEVAFAPVSFPTPEKFRVISPNWVGLCPLVDPEGLCLLHKECGEEYLPDVCRLFPRADHHYVLSPQWELETAVCSGSCEGVLELIPKNDPMNVQILLDPSGTDAMTGEQKSNLSSEPMSFSPREMIRLLEQSQDQFPELTLLMEPLELIRILQDRTAPLEERVMTISRKTGYDHRVQPQEVRDSLQEFYKISPELEEILDPMQISVLSKEQEAFIENMIVNHLLYSRFPNTDPRLKPADSARGLQVLYQLFQWVRERDEYHYNVLFHLTEHTAFYYNARVLIG